MKHYVVEGTWPTGTGGDLVHVKKYVVQAEDGQAAIDQVRHLHMGADYTALEVPAHKLSVGTKVVFVNDYGVAWPGKRITALAEPMVDGQPRYYISPTGAPWFPVPESSLKVEAWERLPRQEKIRKILADFVIGEDGEGGDAHLSEEEIHELAGMIDSIDDQPVAGVDLGRQNVINRLCEEFGATPDSYLMDWSIENVADALFQREGKKS